MRIARGEVVVVNEKFGIRLTDVVERDGKDGARAMTGMAQPASPLSVGSVAQLSLSLVAIISLIFAVSWALKRFKLANPGGRGEIRVIDELALGPRERIVLLRVGDANCWLASAPAG